MGYRLPRAESRWLLKSHVPSREELPYRLPVVGDGPVAIVQILAQSRHLDGNENWGNFMFEDVDGGGDVREVGRGVLDRSGHLSYLSGNGWILNDTYPKGSARMQTPHLFHVSSGRRIDLGDFHPPSICQGEWRVDTHPRLSRDGKLVCIDAPQPGRKTATLDRYQRDIR